MPPLDTMTFICREAYACPTCRGALTDSTAPDGSQQFDCPACNVSYPVRDGIAYLLPVNGAHLDVKAREREGWKQVFEQNKWQATAEIILGLPDLSTADTYWRKVALSWEMVEAALYPLKGKVGVDLASGIGWATAKFVQGGASMIAMDFNDTEYNGLRAAIRTREEPHSLRFDAVCADSEQLPLAGGSVDFVFISSALHHFTRPELALREIARILKPDGLLVDICEAFRTGFRDDAREEEYQVLQDFRSAGINEQSFTQREYERLYTNAGLELATYFPHYDRPTDSTPGPHWINSNARAAARQHHSWWKRMLVGVVIRTPLISLLRWIRLHLRITDRVFIARKAGSSATARR